MPDEDLPKPRVLVVDDDPRLLHIVSLYLQVQSLEVISANSGEEALQLIAAGLPDLIISDVMMPGIDGIELCRRIRAQTGTNQLPIIIFTALSDDSDVDAAKKAGANMMITKPFNLIGLGEVVRSLLPAQTAIQA